jgi:hypothetical protein
MFSGAHIIIIVAAVTLAACGTDRSSPRAGAVEDAGSPSPSSVVPGSTLDPSDAGAASSDSGTAVGPPQPAPPSPVGGEALTAVDRLPFLVLDEASRHASSYDRNFNNVDFGNSLGTDSAGDWVLMDARGPGCVYRLWFTNFSSQDMIHVYVDDEPTPRIDMRLATVFGGQNAPFTAPLVRDANASSGGFISYVPLPYASSIRITATPNSYYYYNIDYHALPFDSPVTTWDGGEDLSAAKSLWTAAGADPNPEGQSTADELTFALEPNETHVLFDGPGPAEVSSVEMTIPGVSPSAPDGGGSGPADAEAGLGASGALQQLWLSMTWDAHASPDVLAPLGPLFALGNLGSGQSQGLLAGMRDDGTLYLYFPMPFSAHAHIEIVNSGVTAVAGLWARVRHQPFPFAFDQVGTLAVQYNESVPSVNGADLTLIDTSGSGKLVGVVLSEGRQACSNCNIRDYLEGNERVLVDGARTPVVMGTGTEDFFNGGFYFEDGPFGLPSHGNVAHESSPSFDATAGYRFFLSDPISFRNHVRLSLQHGPIDNDDTVASTLVYYYRQPRARLEMTDQLTIGDLDDEAAHGYVIKQADWSGPFTSTFEGEFDTASVTATGRSHRGSSSFVVQIDPGNQGVALRRLLDQQTANQRALVFADGVLVGDWFTAGSNPGHAWREDDIAIPASATAGKSSLSIEVRFVSSSNDWNEYQYEVFSRLP